MPMGETFSTRRWLSVSSQPPRLSGAEWVQRGRSQGRSSLQEVVANSRVWATICDGPTCVAYVCVACTVGEEKNCKLHLEEETNLASSLFSEDGYVQLNRCVWRGYHCHGYDTYSILYATTRKMIALGYRASINISKRPAAGSWEKKLQNASATSEDDNLNKNES